MSRSRKRTPIHGHTCAESDKPFKEREHRRERRVTKRAITGFFAGLTAEQKVAALAVDDDGLSLSPTRAFGNPWNSDKDGKSYWEGNGGYKVMMK